MNIHIVVLFYFRTNYCHLSLKLHLILIKRFTKAIVLLLFAICSQAQIQVVNKNLTPIAGVQLFNGSTFLAISDDQGYLNVDTSSILEYTWTLTHSGFYTRNITRAILVNGSTIILTRSTSSFDPVVISRKGRSSLYKDLSTPIDLISKTKISLYQPQTAADLLNLENKVYIQKSQQGGGSPMIRGFATNRILLVVDGVRMNTAIFREGNVQNVIAIDQFTIGNTEVIFGPASQFYGSDAIGGVLSFETINPAYANSDTLKTSGNVSLRYSSASNEQTVHTDFSFSKRKFASFSSITFNNFGDLKTGKSGPDVYTRRDYVVYTGSNDSIISNSDKNLQVLSGYKQFNFLQKFRFKLTDNIDLSTGIHYSVTSDIPRYDRLIERGSNDTLLKGDWYYGPQKWFMNNYILSIRKPAKIYDSILVTAAFQRFEESRNDRNIYDTKLRQRVETVHAYSLSGDFYKELKNTASFNYGLDYIFNRVGSSGIKLDINDGTFSPTSTRYPDGSSWSSAGVYTNFMQRLRKWYTLEFGFRYNIVNTNGTLDTTFFAYPVQSFNNTNEALTGSIGHIFKLKKGSISLVTSTAFRSPNIDDIAKVFDRNTGFVTVPNPDLAPEYAYNAEVNFNYLILPKLKISTSIFYTYLDNAISIANSKFNGKDSILYENVKSQVQTLTNQDYASVYGSQITLKYLVSEQLTINSSYTLLQSTSSNNEPIKHITPNFGGSSVEYKKDNWFASIYSVYNQEFKNKQLATSELGSAYLYAKDENGLPYSPAWFTLNVRGSVTLSDKFTLNLGIENILNKRYRPYGSGISAAGRNVIFGCKAIF